jgi:hypothetical protein
MNKVLPVNVTSKAFLSDIAGATIGFVGVKMLPTYLPVDWQGNDIKGYAGKVGSVLALSFVVGTLLKKKDMAKAVFLGGVLAVVLDLVNQYVMPMLSGTPAAVSGTGAYIPRSQLRGMGAQFAPSTFRKDKSAGPDKHW